MKRLSVLSLLLWLLLPLAIAQPRLLHRYDATNSRLQGHATMLLQDPDGMLWVATWSGLYRFDGYEFCLIKPQAGDGCSMPSDRLRDIWLSADGNIFVRAEDEVFYFDRRTYRFRDLDGKTELAEAERQRRLQPTRGVSVEGGVDYTDSQGLLWQLRDDALYCFNRTPQPTRDIPLPKAVMVRCIFEDSQHRLWLGTKDDGALCLLDNDAQPKAWLTPSGRLSKAYVSFEQPVYCMTETRSGMLWVGSKPGGLFRLKEQADGHFIVEHIEGLDCPNVYSMAEDSKGRLWIATLGGGLSVVEQPDAPCPTVVNNLSGFPRKKGQRLRYLHITAQGVLLGASTEGLVVGLIEEELEKCRFRLHTREPHRPSSLSCNATMDIVEDGAGHLFISTETGGVCEILSDNLLDDTLRFAHYDVASGHLPTDMTVSLSLQPDGRLLVASLLQFTLLDTRRCTFESFDHQFFQQTCHFSEARPLLLDSRQWIFGTNEGAFVLPCSRARKNNYRPRLAFTGVAIQGGTQDLAVDDTDTLRLSPTERSLTLHFAALDYSAPSNISYQYCIGGDTARWNMLGHEHSLTLLDLKPDTYELALRSTNAEGQWTDNVRRLTIIVEPTFWETPWFTLLVILVLLSVVGVTAYTLLYIRRIKRQRQEALNQYLALLDKRTEHATHYKPALNHATPGEAEKATDPFMQRVLDYVEQNLGNSDVDVSQMAEACAVSRSVLQRKMKQLMGVTPVDFLREARIKHACQLLKVPASVVADVAYKCGFSDPKYFSRCFKQTVGVSPSEYKSQQDGVS